MPQNTVWFTPSDAAVGGAIALNALVYNSSNQNATITVTFTTDQNVKIDAVTEEVLSGSAKTASVNWVMPKNTTNVTAAVTKAVNAKNQTIASLVGTIGTMPVGTTTVTPVIDGISFPGSTQIGAWLAPLLAKAEAFRLKEATYFATLRDSSKIQIGITATPTPAPSQPETPAPANATPAQLGAPQISFGNPSQYITLAYSSALAALFASQTIFYIVFALLILLVLRFIVNLI